MLERLKVRTYDERSFRHISMIRRATPLFEKANIPTSPILLSLALSKQYATSRISGAICHNRLKMTEAFAMFPWISSGGLPGGLLALLEDYEVATLEKVATSRSDS